MEPPVNYVVCCLDSHKHECRESTQCRRAMLRLSLIQELERIGKDEKLREMAILVLNGKLPRA